MHNAAAGAYAKTARTTLSPRALEANLLLRAAHRLQAVSDAWEDGAADLSEALTFNRKIWTVLATSATEPDSPLPAALRNGIAQLAAVIFQRTIDITFEPAREQLALLVHINRDIAAGLASQPAAG